jgi:hypothetical protein
MNGNLDECKITAGEAVLIGKRVEMKILAPLLLDVKVRWQGRRWMIWLLPQTKH